MIARGLDGFGNGWVCVAIGDDRPGIYFVDHIARLKDMPFNRMAIDIPIGLPDISDTIYVRECDRLARQQLRPHQSRVFTGAMRGLWDFASAADANTALKARGQKGISLQLWHLGPKIMQVDTFVQANATLDIREAHPELVFRRLNRHKPLPSKKTPNGIALRRHLLAQNGFDGALLDGWLARERIGTGAKIDDVLDACACAIAARDFNQKFCLPDGDAPKDACGLPMQIWY